MSNMIFLRLEDKLIKYKVHLYFLGFFLLSCSQSFQTFVVRSPDGEMKEYVSLKRNPKNSKNDLDIRPKSSESFL